MTDSRRLISEAGPTYAVIGLILGAHGVTGEVRVRVLSDVPHRFDSGQELYLQGRTYRITHSSSGRSGQAILKLQGVDTQAAARALTGEEITALTDSAPTLPEGEYFHFQLIGLQVLTDVGEDLGRISEILVTGSNDVYVVSGPSGEILLPALAQVIKSVDLEGGTMTVRLMEGLR